VKERMREGKKEGVGVRVSESESEKRMKDNGI